MTKLNTDPIFVVNMQGYFCTYTHCSTATIYFVNWLDQALISNKKPHYKQIMNSMCFVCIHRKFALATAYIKYW